MRTLANVVICAPLLVATGAAAQPYPAKPIRMVVAFPPGGTTDVMGRILAAKLSERLGQQVVIDNRPGASGIIGADIVAKSRPDGYTLLMSSSTLGTISSLYRNVPFDTVKDFEPVAFIATTPYVMVVHPSLSVKSVRELIDYAKAHPGKLAYAGSTPGTAQHLGWEQFKRMTGTDMLYVPYKGSGALMPDLLSGRLQAGIDNVVVLAPHVKSGALRGIAVTGEKRSPVIPELPTIAEAGVAGFQAIGWFGVFASANTPPAIVRKLNGEIAAIMQQSDVRDLLLAQGAEPVSGPPDDLRKLLAREIAVWSNVILEAGIKIE